MEFYCKKIPCIVLIRFKAFQFYRNSQNLKLRFCPSKEFYLLFEKKNKYKNEKLARGVLRLFTYQRAAGVSAVQFHQEPLFPLY